MKLFKLIYHTYFTSVDVMCFKYVFLSDRHNKLLKTRHVSRCKMDIKNSITQLIIDCISIHYPQVP
jgi:hypothetical protein